jgi:hypothetical protein
MSISSIALLPIDPAHLLGCPWLGRCTRTLIADGCASCRFSSAGFNSNGEQPDPAAGLHLVAINFCEAAC